jgi:dTDP-4-amino-4,6-dideoxygalactose transaminase
MTVGISPKKTDPDYRISHSSPTLGPEDERAVAQAVASGTLVNGPAVENFERELARRLQRRRAIALTSGSTALHLALRAMRAGPGDQVAIPSYTCVSVLQAVRRAGAEPLPIDCDPATFHMDPDDLRRRLTGRTVATILDHTFGLPAEFETIASAGPPVIEDVATAVGARFDGGPAGSDGRCTVCSFNATKVLTTGGGGAVLSDDLKLMSRVSDRVDYDARGDARVRYNERLGELGASLGLAQLARLESFIGRRREIAQVYRNELEGTDLLLPPDDQWREPVWHRFVVRVTGGSDWIRTELADRGIASPRPVYQPLHQILGRGDYPGAETAHREALSLPIYPSLGDDDVRFVAEEVRRCLTRH